VAQFPVNNKIKFLLIIFKGHSTCKTKNYFNSCNANYAQHLFFNCCLYSSNCDYIGKTLNTLRSRVNGHRQSVKEAKPLPVAQHAINEHNLHKLEDCFEI